jgi:hypothetical protein
MDTNLPTPDDSSRAEDHADPGRERGPGFFDLGCLSNLAVPIGVFLCGYLVGRKSYGSFRVMMDLFFCLAVTILCLAALRNMMRSFPAADSVRWPRFFALGCLSNLVVLIGAFLWGCLLGCHAFLFNGAPGGMPGGGLGYSTTGIEGGIYAMEFLILYFLVFPFLPLVVWIIAVAAYKAKHAAVQRGAGKRKFFLDKDE